MDRDLDKIAEEVLLAEINNSPLLYELIKKNKDFRFILNNVNDKKVVSNVNPKEIISAEMQVVYLMNRLINRFDDHFPLLYKYRKSIIEEFLEFDETKEFLSCKHYLGNNKYIKYFEDSLNRIFVKSFYNNLNYYKYFLADILKERNIYVKRLSLKNSNHLRLLVDFLSDLSYCYNEWDAFYIFIDVAERVNYYKTEKEYQNHKDNNWLDIVLRDHITHIGRIIGGYKKKKKYLKFFKK